MVSFSLLTKIRGVLCVVTFVFGYLLGFGLRSNSTLEGAVRSAAARTIRPSSALMPAGMTERCSQGEIASQVELFKVATGSGKSSCPKFNYLPNLEAFAGLEPVVFDVGCNKGYDTAMMFEAFTTEEALTRVSLGKFYKSHKQLKAVMSAMNGGMCGVCQDCMQTFDSSSSSSSSSSVLWLRGPALGRRLQVHCFEPSATNYKALSEMRKHFFGSSNKTARGNELRLYNAALSDHMGTVAMPSNCGELCQVKAERDDSNGAPSSSATDVGGGSTTTVPLTTVDAMVERLRLQRLFMLKIDTEGLDPLVLRGAKKALAGRKVDLLLFEYNSGGAWGTDGFTLRAVTAELEGYGYICYFEGTLLTRITGCWSDALEVNTWSNIICVASDRQVQAVLRAYSMAPFQGRYV